MDLQPMAPIEGVTQIQGDITSAATAAEVRCSLIKSLSPAEMEAPCLHPTRACTRTRARQAV